jgi:hypothetical protein
MAKFLCLLPPHPTLSRWRGLKSTALSLDRPPFDGKAVHHLVDDPLCVSVRVGRQVSAFGGGEDGTMAEDLLHLEQVDACLQPNAPADRPFATRSGAAS